MEIAEIGRIFKEKNPKLEMAEVGRILKETNPKYGNRGGRQDIERKISKCLKSWR